MSAPACNAASESVFCSCAVAMTAADVFDIAWSNSVHFATDRPTTAAIATPVSVSAVLSFFAASACCSAEYFCFSCFVVEVADSSPTFFVEDA